MHAETAAIFNDLLGLRTRPIAISFVDEKPRGLERAAPEPAGCGYWRRAAEGEVFYTEAEDHLKCPIGAHTHAAPLTPPAEQELGGMLKMMSDLGYIKMEEVAGIPRRKTPLRYAIYGPLEAAPSADVALFRGTARQLMLLAEAASAAGVSGETPAMGRPTCAVIPEALNSGKTAASFGCVGNRVYTAARDEDSYFAVPGAALSSVAEKLGVIAKANDALEAFHRSRLG